MLARRTCSVVCVAVTAVAGCSGSSGGSPTAVLSSSRSAPVLVTVTGSVVLARAEIITENGPGTTCWAYGNAPTVVAHTTAFDDVKEGAQVVVTDASGATVGVGALGAGVASGTSPADYVCRFAFTVAGVPSGPKFYGVKIGNQPAKQVPSTSIAHMEIDLG
jgi:hypothetical protein